MYTVQALLTRKHHVVTTTFLMEKFTALVNMRRMDVNDGRETVAMYFKVTSGLVYYMHVDQSKSPWSLTPKLDTEKNWRKHLQFTEFIPTHNFAPRFTLKLHMNQTDGGHTHLEIEGQAHLSEHFDGVESESDSTTSTDYYTCSECVEQESDSDDVDTKDDDLTTPGNLESKFDTQTGQQETDPHKETADSNAQVEVENDLPPTGSDSELETD